MSDDEPLAPARPDAEVGDKSYGPRLPWKWIALVVLGLGTLFGSFYVRERSKATSLREQIVTTYEQRVEPAARRYRAFRGQLEDWTAGAARTTPTNTADPRLRLAALHGADGLYLRLRRSDAESLEGIARGAVQMGPDAITRCLGIAPTSARGLFEHGAFLAPGWLSAARNEESLMRLRVLDHELVRRAQRDLPNLMTQVASRYFLLVLEHGENRRDAPVDVFLWDLRQKTQLLSLRAKADGVLIPARIAMAGAPHTKALPRADTGGAYDCSIAAQIKELAGESTPTVTGTAGAAATPTDT